MKKLFLKDKKKTLLRLKLKGVSRDANGNLCAEEITSPAGLGVAKSGQCQWEGVIVIEKGMERWFDFKEPVEKEEEKGGQR